MRHSSVSHTPSANRAFAVFALPSALPPEEDEFEEGKDLDHSRAGSENDKIIRESDIAVGIRETEANLVAGEQPTSVQNAVMKADEKIVSTHEGANVSAQTMYAES